MIDPTIYTLRTANLKVGDRIELVDMPGDPDPVAVGTRGTIEMVRLEVDQAFVKWDDGRSLGIASIDTFRVIERVQP